MIFKPTTRTFLVTTLLAGVLFLSKAEAQTSSVAGVTKLPAEAEIEFAGTSTLHDFGGKLPAQPFFLTLSNRTWSAEADVLSGLMATDNDKRDAKMHEMFHTNSFPKIHGRVTAAPIPLLLQTNATLALKIRDKETQLPVLITDWVETETEIRFHAEWDVSLKQYALKPPSVLGFIRVGDVVHLKAAVIAHKDSAVTNQTELKK